VALRETVMRNGRRTGRPSTLDECRARCADDMARLPVSARRIGAPVAPRATSSGRLTELTAQVRHRVENTVAAHRSAPG
jgi:nicotinate phosphoribosyltransferase